MSGIFSTPRDIAQEHASSDKALQARKRAGNVWRVVFYVATTIAIIALVTLLLNIIDGAFGYVAWEFQNDPVEILGEGRVLEDLDKSELIQVLEDNVRNLLKRRWQKEAPLPDQSVETLRQLVLQHVLEPDVLNTWNLFESIFNRAAIDAWVDEFVEHPEKSWLEFRSWISLEFIGSGQALKSYNTGIRTGIFGSILIIVFTILFAFPIGVGAAIYLEEYARPNRLNRFIQVNIYNLAGVPSIIYGLLGLVIFVRLFAFDRTIIAGALTLALLILPIIIINAQEAIRAVPQSLRDSSYGIGATKWQTVWNHVLPASMDRILTGTILSISRALGETAPLVVVGASTFVSQDPSGLLSKFTTMPIQIYDWAKRPQDEFRNLAAAAIIILLILLLSLNASAIILRNRISKKRRDAA